MTRVFAFVESQFSAVFGLAIDLILLVAVRYMIEQERRVDADRTEVLPLQARLEYPSAGGAVAIASG